MQPILKPAFALLLITILVGALAGGLYPAVAHAQSGNQWAAYYYNNPDWAGNPVYIAGTTQISYNWGEASPATGVPWDNFTGSYVTDAFFYAGTYAFTSTADDEVAIVVDGVTYLDTRGQGLSGKNQTVYVPMWQGTHRVEVYYREYSQSAYLYVTWSYVKDDGYYPPAPVPPAPPAPVACGPQSEASVQTEFGDYTPCIEQGIHQVTCFQSTGQWNAPNYGSIQNEPQIEVWMACTPDSVANFTVSCDAEEPQEEFKCSKTGAGYFRN
jgi:hypothetical protein